MTDMPPDQAFSVAVGLALKVISAKSLVYLALGMSFGLFCWAMATASVLALATAATFALMVFLPALLKGFPKSS